jgi:hypothetical protein
MYNIWFTYANDEKIDYRDNPIIMQTYKCEQLLHMQM